MPEPDIYCSYCGEDCGHHSEEIARLRLERDLWRKLAEARSGILVAYRIGGRPPGKHLDAARDAERRLADLLDNGGSE